MPESLVIEFPGYWDEVRRIQDEVERQLSFFHRDIREAAVITASELTENAIKYGEPVKSLPFSELSVSVQGNQITFTIRNGLKRDDLAQEVHEHVERISKSNDRRELYLNRLREMLKNPYQRGSKLGLYRIGYEGQFDLTCQHQDDVLTITATRRVS